MDGFAYILLSEWFAWCQVFVSGKLIHACHIHWCSVVEVVVDMLRVPSLQLVFGCMRIVLINNLYSLFLDEEVSITICCSSLSASVLCVCRVQSSLVKFDCDMFMWMCCCQKV